MKQPTPEAAPGTADSPRPNAPAAPEPYLPDPAVLDPMLEYAHPPRLLFARLAHAPTHAIADVTLRDLDREFDPNCWDCHSAAALKEGAARLPAVTCVACHRVGPATATGHEILEPLTVNTCLPCHTVGKSPEFTEERYWPAVVH